MPTSPTLPAVLRVLVADDIAASREQLCGQVRALGHLATGVGSGQAALEQCLSQSVDLVLLDLLMPDMDGFEVTRRLRTEVTDRWLPVIVTSSLEGEEHFVHALQQGADDYLVRPISRAMLDVKLRHYARVLGLQSSLAALAQRQRVIHDNILDVVLTLSEQGRIEESNLAAQRLFGREQTQLTGLTCEQVLGASLPDLMGMQETLLRRADGSEFPAELVFSSWVEQGRPQHTLVIRDLTERRRIERMKDEFLATVSHELRTPLTSVLGALGLLASGAAGALPKAALMLAEVAQRNGQRLSRLIDDVLDLTKLEGNQMVLQLRPTALDALLPEALSSNQGYAQQAGVKLTLELAQACPPVQVDADRFLQVMANLLSNAIKHSTAGDTVRVRLGCSAHGVRVSVIDTGPGVDAQFRSRMFEKFSQADGSDQRAKGGTGLGLYVCRLFVERMGGRISCDSAPGQGATFSLDFPLSHRTLPVNEPWLLLIDSDVDVRRRVADWLMGVCRVEGAADLKQAEALSVPHRPTLILADPQAQGAAEEFCLALKRLAAGHPVILYSDSVDRSFVDRLDVGWLRKARTSSDEVLDLVRSAIVKSGNTPSWAAE